MTNVQKRPLLTCGVIALVATLLAVGGIALALWARANAVEAAEARNRADAVTFAHQFGYTPEREIGFRDECIYSGFERTCTIYVMFTSPLDKQAVQQVVDGFPRGPKTPSRIWSVLFILALDEQLWKQYQLISTQGLGQTLGFGFLQISRTALLVSDYMKFPKTHGSTTSMAYLCATMYFL